MNKGANIVSNAITGNDFKTVIVNGKGYTVYPPTIERLSGAISHLSQVHEADTLRDILFTLGDCMKLANALSWFIEGDESLIEELKKGKYEEIVDALETCISMISIETFRKAVSSARSVSQLAARTK